MIYLIGKGRFAGVKNVIVSQIKFAPFRVNLNDFDALIITSKNALRALGQSESKLNLAIKLYVVGDESAKFAKKMGFVNIKTPPKAYGKDLAKAFKDELAGKKCLYLRAKKIASNLDDELIKSGANLSQIIAYENAYKAPKEPLKLEKNSVFIFTSPLSVQHFLKTYTLGADDKCVAIGETTAAALPQNKSIFMPTKQSIKACVELAKSLAQSYAPQNEK